MRHVLICGGAGYIGSHMARWLGTRGARVTVLDNLSTGHREAVKWGKLVEADLLDRSALQEIFAANKFDAVMHFCARSLVGESVVDPYPYYINNVVGTLNLLEVMRRSEVDRLVFSSTAAVFGQPSSDTVDEDHPKMPINPYGASKLMVEQILSDAATAYGLRSVTLRYFNAAGASDDASIGESHQPETHLIPSVIRSAMGVGPGLKVFGTDYATPDGTCVRDYVHVDDLAHAHELALGFMDAREGAYAFNLGNGRGFTVKEVIEVVASITGRVVKWEAASRRAGDPPVLVAASKRARRELGWLPVHDRLDSIVRSAWNWHQSQKF